MELFWLILLLIAFQPMFKKKILEIQRQRFIRRMESKRNSRVILLVHRQERLGFLGIPLFKFIDIHDAEEVLRAIHMTDSHVQIDLVLHTPGGLVLPSLQIANALHKHPGKVTVLIPHYAMSGGTLIALAADEIVMCEHGVLGPVDPQLSQYPAASLLKILEQKDLNEIEDKTLILADQAQKATTQVRSAVVRLLENKMGQQRAKELAALLTEGAWTHDYPIDYNTAKNFGLPISDRIPEELLHLLSLYPQPVRQQGTVEYSPAPRKRDKEKSNLA